MTKRERTIIRKELEMCYRCSHKNFWLDATSDEYYRSVTRLVQMEVLATQLCPTNSTVEEYFGWNEDNKANQRRMVARWREESKARRER